MLAEPRGEGCCLRGAGGTGGTAACCRCAHTRRSSPLTCLAVCFLVLTYNLLGGFLFLALEGSEDPAGAVAASKPNLSHAGGPELRARTVERLWSITEDLNILYKENWTQLAAQELAEFQRALVDSLRERSSVPRRSRWTFSTSFLYALTLITTIGEGEVAPRSAAGRLVAVAYACVGIPIIMLYLSTLGEALARYFRALYSRLRPRLAGRHAPEDCGARPEGKPPPDSTPFHAALNLTSLRGYHWTCRDHTRVPAPLSALLVAGYVALGTLLFRATEKWTLIDGCYFSFSSLATIGFGDLRPGLYASTVSAKAEDLAVGVCCLYILVGIVVVAMCFNLIQEDMSAALRTFSTLCTGSKSRAVHSAERACDAKVALSVAP